MGSEYLVWIKHYVYINTLLNWVQFAVCKGGFSHLHVHCTHLLEWWCQIVATFVHVLMTCHIHRFVFDAMLFRYMHVALPFPLQICD